MRKPIVSLLVAASVATGLSYALQRVAGSQRAPQAIAVKTTDADPSKRVSADIRPYRGHQHGNVIDASSVTQPESAPMRVPGDGTTIYGSLIYSTTGSYAGIYSFKASENPAVQLTIPFNEGYEANGGGTAGNGKYYFNSYVYTPEMGYTFSTFLVYDFATGSLTKTIHSFMDSSFDQSQITHDMTYDPVTGTIYAIAYTKEVVVEGIMEKFVPALAVIDDYTGFASAVGATPGLIAIACNNAGELYGVTKNGKEGPSSLYRINKTTAECTLIGATGLNPEYVQSMTFDPVTDKLYWAETEVNGTSGLYQVDLATGRADKITAFANDEEFTGLYIPQPDVDAGAPAAVTDLTPVFANGALSGKLTFTVPTKAYDGTGLSGAVTADLLVDGALYKTLTVQPGAAASVDLTLTEGLHSANIQLSNGKGEGPRTGLAWYVGIDAPAAVGDLRLEADGANHPVISWTAPTTGRNSGYIDPAQLTYTVVRMPENAVVARDITATSFTDLSSFDTAEVYYTVTPSCGGRVGVEASTATGVFGQGSDLPVTYSFDTADDFRLTTIIDANDDFDAQYTWGGWVYGPDFTWANTADNGCLVYAYSPTSAADDWAILAPFQAVAGHKYRITFNVKVSSDAETLTVTAGNAATVVAQKVVTGPTKYTNRGEYQTYTAEFTADTDGNCYIGFHCTSAKKAGYLYIDDVTVDEVPETSAPAAVSDLTVTPGAAGALTATISCVAPRLTAGGANLSSLTAVTVFRGNDNTPLHVFSNPTPGATLSWTDTEALQGYNTYRVVASNAAGQGEKAVATAYIGYDLPEAPGDFTLVETDGQPVLTWSAPQQGLNGGYINPDELIYRIRRSDGSLVASRATGTTFTDPSMDPTFQDFIYYQIEAVSAAGAGDYALSNPIFYGQPYTGDFFESFSDAVVRTNPWVTYRIKGSSQLWNPRSQGYSPYCAPADGDGGLLVFEATSGHAGDEGRIVSPKIALGDMDVPLLSFVFYHNLDEDTAMGGDQFQDRMTPEILLPDGNFVALTAEPIYVDEPMYETGWYMYRFNLTPFKDYDYIQLSFHGYASFANDIHIDMVSVESNVEYDLMAYTFNAPAAVKAGRDIDYRLSIYNQGLRAADNYSVKLYEGDNLIAQATELPTIYSGSMATIDITVPTTLDDEGRTLSVYAVIDWADDTEVDNNTTMTVNTDVTGPDVPEVLNVNAAVTGNTVNLQWTDANALHVDDSFEDYTAFSIDRIGDYTTVDGDGGLTYTFAQINYPNSGDPMAFMVFNPAVLGITTILPEWAAATGDQVLAAFSACDDSGSPIDSDDWLISPVVHGATEVTFKAKTANYEWGLETFEVLYSVSGTEPADFRQLSGSLTAGADWDEYSFTLPADARYFAIHYTSNDGFVFYVDDLQYIRRMAHGQMVHTGFKVYRDHTEIAILGTDDRSYTDAAVADGNHQYAVTALFGKYESKPVLVEAEVGQSGVGEVASDIKLSVADGTLVANGSEAFELTVTNVAGVTVYAGVGHEAYSVRLTPGVYLVRTADVTRKIVVK